MSENGEPAGGFVGFLKSLGWLCSQFSPSKVIVVWESGGNHKRRNESGGSYKNGRRAPSLNRYYKDDIPNTKENFTLQVALTIEALKNLPIHQIYVKDTEADDVISYICTYKFLNNKIVVVSSDRDLYQLIDDRVNQWSLNQKKIIDIKEVIQKFGVSPKNWCVARAFIGDDSDEIDGVKGAGFKTISKRFPELSGDHFVSVSEVVQKAKSLSESSNSHLLKSIAQSEDLAKRNWKLMHLDVSRLNGDQVKRINHQLDTTAPSPNKMALLRLLVREGLKTIDIDLTFSNIKAAVND